MLLLLYLLSLMNLTVNHPLKTTQDSRLLKKILECIDTYRFKIEGSRSYLCDILANCTY